MSEQEKEVPDVGNPLVCGAILAAVCYLVCKIVESSLTPPASGGSFSGMLDEIYSFISSVLGFLVGFLGAIPRVRFLVVAICCFPGVAMFFWSADKLGGLALLVVGVLFSYFTFWLSDKLPSNVLYKIIPSDSDEK